MIQVYDKYGKIKSSGIPGYGTVTAVSSGNLSPLFTTAVTSPTSTPNISFSPISQSQKLFYASPNGSSGTPTFRAILASDLPSLTSIYVPTSRTITINGVTYDLSSDRSWTINSATWGNITGTITSQLDLIAYLSNNYYPLLSNPANYITQDQVVEYPNLASFPPTGTVGVVYIALDTDLAYVWDTGTSSYVLTSMPDTGITGIGKTNRIAKFNSPTNLVWSKISEDPGTGSVKIVDSNRPFINGNSVLSVQRGQSQVDIVLGNPGYAQPSMIWSDNDLDGFEVRSKGILSLKAGSSYTEGLKVLTDGKLQITQAPDTGTTSDLVLVRDSSGNVKTITYPVATGFVPYTGATQDVDLGEYELKAGQVEFDQTPTGTAGTAIMRWNDTDGTVDLGLKGGNVTLQVGQENVVRVVNKTGSNLLESNYQVVRVRLVSEGGAAGQRLAVVLAQANNDTNSATTLGIVTENINNNQKGFITVFGSVREINTTGSLQGETWVDGDILYLSPTTPGQLTNIKPSAPQHLVTVGYVEYAHAIHGKIFVKVDNGYELDELHNVDITSPANNQILTYNSSTQVWENKNIADVASERRNANNSTNSNINYCGTAPSGSLESATVWTIIRLTISSSGSVTTATATNVAWTNRESTIYI